MRRLVSSVLWLVMLSGAALSQQFKIDPAHSSAQFAVKHMLVSTVHGRFTDVQGTIIYDPQDVTKSSVKAVITSNSITTDNTHRDSHLKSADFFEVEKYPTITFTSSRIEKHGDEMVAFGTLTIKDVSKSVEIPFALQKADNPKGAKLGVDASLKLNRQDYHVSWDKTGATVGQEVKIDLSIEANEVK